ncbi:hypothetical protein BKK79_07795 [Cupriavidus sp. USMAA2-4]|uniref:Chromosome partitioning protein ParB n=1 Tax=Cupriavidus malaysiensis TaxID=367825 RepID=A0ABM6F250_9BURK|nr:MULTISPECIES: ParB-like protein [Cupriavidus]AOY91711.1 hypothetical protein BKK79_07795 [Cupriavidus sp. USMAA2-4]AOY98732.1 hypothetical protein BKK81_05130 [Cupriavidus sp. USMAHM13]AOZ05164.1 hypothetical protein BKK80_04475 [Cupriavidus malaysiensis]
MAKLREALIHDLHPTQITVGMIEVHDKKKHLAALSAAEQKAFMQAHPIPAVVGPAGKLFITDHHHLGRAALEAGVTSGFFTVEADLSDHAIDAFWAEMNKNLWVHPLDQNGVRHYYAQIPSHLSKLVDDPYRSLAGYVRDAGGYEKTPTAFAEFVWADFFRRAIPVEDVSTDFQRAVQAGIALAKGSLASGLPGCKTR